MSITLRDIAQKACVSVSTVSRALNDYPYIGDGTRAAVWQAARELGYPLENLRTPNRGRTVLMLTRNDEIQLLQDVSTAGIERAISSGAQAIFEQNQIETRIQRTRMLSDEPSSYARDPNVAGIIILGGMVDRSFLTNIQKAGLPCLVAGSHVRPLRIDCVMADYAGGMAQMISHLARTGRRCIGLVNGPATTTSSEEKYNGFRLALALHDLPFSAAQVVAQTFSSEGGYRGTLQLLDQMPAVDAIAYADDNMAMGGLFALKEAGASVPDDVAVAGFHDYHVARFTDPPLTTIHFDMQLMGTIAARRLCMLLEAPDDEAWTIMVPTELKVRNST